MQTEYCMNANVFRTGEIVLVGGLTLMNGATLAQPPSFDRNVIVEKSVDVSPDSNGTREKTRVNAKKHLARAKSAKKDEFYTQYSDIQRELELYVKYNSSVFKDKVVLLPCDDPTKSNFTKYFIDNFRRLGLRKLISTSYSARGKGKALVITSEDNFKSDDDSIVKFVNALTGDGDFRSDEIKKYRDEADIIVTNPPFSLFRQFFLWLADSHKQFLVIGNVNCISYKEVYPYIMRNEVWLGHGIGRWISGFIVPEDYDLYGTETKVDECGNRIIASNSCLWLTNIDHGHRHESLKLMTMQENIMSSRHRDVRGHEYRKYDNCDAIEIPHTDSIPSDYKGLMGVPITFLDKYCPEQFELVRFRKGDDGKDLRLDGEPTYFRILIKAR